MVRWCSISLLTTGWKVFDRCVSVVFWLVVISLVMFGVGLARDLIAGAGSSFQRFGLGGLWIHYEVRTGGVLPERLGHVIIAEAFPVCQSYEGSTNRCTLAFGDPDSITIYSEGREISWTDDQGHVTRLGPGWALEDIGRLENSVTVRPKRGETIWIDEQRHVTSLGRALSLEDIATLRNARSGERSTISSPGEFLAIVSKLRTEPAAAREDGESSLRQ